MSCTGIAASWCPVHGDCTCPRDETGEIEWHYEGASVRITANVIAWDATAIHVSHFDSACPLHGDTTDHAEQEVEAA